ncbi:MAG TPA: SIS domain-containing protein [Puia sp.]|nr:SIS domain-containing protein [Puia sp.]
MNEKIQAIITESLTVKSQVLGDLRLIGLVGDLVTLITDRFRQGKHLYFCGNGGSAADAQHLAAEFSGRFYINRDALPSEALHCNTSYLTAVANDFSYELIYSRLIKGIGKPGDILVGLSTSGNSVNILKAFITAREKGITTIGMTGEGGGELKQYSDYLIDIPSRNTPRIQEAHMLLGHIICQLVEEKYFTPAP